MKSLNKIGRSIADATWACRGPASGEFASGKRDLSRLPAAALSDLEQDRGKPYTAVERRAISQGYRERMAELLEAHIEKAKKLLKRVRG